MAVVTLNAVAPLIAVPAPPVKVNDLRLAPSKAPTVVIVLAAAAVPTAKLIVSTLLMFARVVIAVAVLLAIKVSIPAPPLTVSEPSKAVLIVMVSALEPPVMLLAPAEPLMVIPTVLEPVTEKVPVPKLPLASTVVVAAFRVPKANVCVFRLVALPEALTVVAVLRDRSSV